ncbi:MAG TPA: matrixin family metalloprotease [Candidatus Limnocylindria bacterium]|nr:matrixin family metalloprotease [Candidatus Limnocylindria bacterium]
MTRLVSLLLLVAAPLAISAYDFVTTKGLRWPAGEIPMNLQLDATRDSQFLSDGKASWNEVAEEALAIWNSELSYVQFTSFTSSQRGDGNGHNEVFFSTNAYGHPLGDRVLAITTAWKIGSERVEGDTIVNSDVAWDSLRGPIGFFDFDLRRVLIHEFGHTLGLDHPDEARQVVVAVMNSIVSDLDTLALDDIHGVRALYPPDAAYALNFSIVPPGSGSVFAKAPPDINGRYPAGSLVTFLAKPQRRFRFNFWGGDENRTGGKLVVLVVDDENITLNFSTNGAPVIRAQPRHQIASTGDTIMFSARVSTSRKMPSFYQWQHDGNDVPNATNTTLVLPFVGHESSGLYSLRASNARGETFSKPARLVVDGH